MTKKKVPAALHLLLLALFTSVSVAHADPGTGGGTGLNGKVIMFVTEPAR